MLPFRVEFSERAVADLHRRIDAARWPALPFAADGTEGPDDADLRGLVRRWRSGFDWFAVQARLNRLAHLRGPLGDPEGELHCVLFAPAPPNGGGADGGAAPFPLLLLRGWPGSFLDALPAAGLLADGVGGGPPFEVVVPSLPGLGFSDAPPRAGMHPGRIAGRMHHLMRVLGYERYGVHGEGEGAAVASRLAERRPDTVVGLHLGSAPPLPPPAEAERTPEEDDWRSRLAARERKEDALAALEAARPLTLAYALHDSPVGLLAWLLDRSRAGRGVDGGAPWGDPDRDALLANATLHWLTGSAPAAARARLEARREQASRAPSRVEVPTAFAPAPGDPLAPPRAALERWFRLVRRSEPPRGAPEPPAEDIAAFFGALA